VGSVSDTVVVPVVADEPAALLTMMSHSPVPLCVKVPTCALATDSEGAATWITVTVSEPVAAVPKFMWTVSPPPNALPVFITLVGEFAGMFAMIWITGKLLPPAIASVLVQVAVCVPVPLQIQEAAVVEKLFTV
jgi:hypothetical protein